MSDPSYLRFFAATDGGPVSEIAWAFMRRMIRMRPVRLVSMTTALAGRWVGYESLLATPMDGTFINVVCCDPSRWTWIAKTVAHRTQLRGDQLAAGLGSDGEVISQRCELWTEGVRNVLIAASEPRSAPELATALKYDEIIVMKRAAFGWWRMSGGVAPALIEPPYGEDQVRRAITGLA